MHCIQTIYRQYQLLRGSSVDITHHAAMTSHKAHCWWLQWWWNTPSLLCLQMSANNVLHYCAVYDIYIQVMKKSNCRLTLFYPSHAFGGVRCGCECDTPTSDSLLSNRYPWGCKPPPEPSSRFIRICVHSPCLEYGQHSLDAGQVIRLQNRNVPWEMTQGWLSTILHHGNEWLAITIRDVSTCRQGLTHVIMVRLESMHLNRHQWAIQVMIHPYTTYLLYYHQQILLINKL